MPFSFIIQNRMGRENSCLVDTAIPWWCIITINHHIDQHRSGSDLDSNIEPLSCTNKDEFLCPNMGLH